MDKGLNELLKWSIKNSTTTKNDPDAAPPTNRGLDPEAMAALLGGPSDAELMKAAMEVVTAPDDSTVTLADRLTAFDNFEQLVESLDNANNMAPLALWPPLLAQLGHAEADMRRMAAWCVGTAVQNNEPSQERLVALGGIPALVGLVADPSEKSDVRRKAVYALSSACRNYQPAMDACAAELEKKDGKSRGKVDAANMDAVDEVMDALKDSLKETAA